MTLLRVISAATIFVGVFLGVLQFQDSAAIGIGLIITGLLLMLAITLLERRRAPRQPEIPIPSKSPRDG